MQPIESFNHESIQQVDWVGRFLQALTEGFNQRRLTLKTESETLTLTPAELVDFSLKVTRRKDQSRLTIKVAWRDATLAQVRKSNFISIET